MNNIPIILPPTKEECEKLVTPQEKMSISVVSGLIFLLISSPMVYRLTDSLTKFVGFRLANSAGCPTPLGLFVHTLVFVVIVRLMMK